MSVDRLVGKPRAANSRDVVGARIAKGCGVEAPIVPTSDQSADCQSKYAEQYGGNDARAELQRKVSHPVSTKVELYLYLLILHPNRSAECMKAYLGVTVVPSSFDMTRAATPVSYEEW